MLWLLWAKKRSILAVVAMATGATLLLLSQKPDLYVSSAEVLVRPDSRQSGGGAPVFQPGASMEPARRMATSEAVREGARKRLGSARPIPPISVTSPKESYSLLFSVSSTSPEGAQRIVSAAVEAFRELRHQELIADIATARQPIEAHLAELGGELERVSAALAQAVEPERSVLQPRYNALLNQRQELEQQRDALGDPSPQQAAEILQPASLPSSPVGPKRVKYLALAVVLGGVLGAGHAIAGALITPRLPGRRALTTEARVPAFALIPRFRRGMRELPAVTAPESATADEYHVLSAMIMRLARHTGLRTLLVTSANPGEGKSATAANLAVSMARAGTATVLFLAGRGTGPERYFPELWYDTVPSYNGHEAGRDVVTHPVASIEGLYVAGMTGTTFFRNLLDPGVAREVIDELQSGGRLVIIDGPPVLRGAEGLTMAPLADAVLVVAAADRTSCASLHEACARLERVGASTIGTALTNVPAARIWFERRFDRQAEGASWIPMSLPLPAAPR
jgi:Mrp family chromosome partitioning ATPase/capsular polysaccharide biosynthesis protein